MGDKPAEPAVGIRKLGIQYPADFYVNKKHKFHLYLESSLWHLGQLTRVYMIRN